MNDNEQIPLWALIIEKAMFCESGTWVERLAIALGMAGTGTLILFAPWGVAWMSPGIIRGLVAWICFTVFFAKASNLFTDNSGGPIVSGILGIPIVASWELFLR